MLLKETGWTRHELLWKVSYINLQMMLADVPGYSSSKNKKKKVTGKQLSKMFHSKK